MYSNHIFHGHYFCCPSRFLSKVPCITREAVYLFPKGRYISFLFVLVSGYWYQGGSSKLKATISASMVCLLFLYTRQMVANVLSPDEKLLINVRMDVTFLTLLLFIQWNFCRTQLITSCPDFWDITSRNRRKFTSSYKRVCAVDFLIHSLV